jgi:hypothetical protein
MITPDMLTWSRRLRGPDDNNYILGYIRCCATDPVTSITDEYTFVVGTDYELMKPKARWYYFWYVVATMTRNICTDYYEQQREQEEQQRLVDYEWWKRNSSMFS